MHVEEHRDFKALVTTEERVAFVNGWYAALKAESPATNLQQPHTAIALWQEAYNASVSGDRSLCKWFRENTKRIYAVLAQQQ